MFQRLKSEAHKKLHQLADASGSSPPQPATDLDPATKRFNVETAGVELARRTFARFYSHRHAQFCNPRPEPGTIDAQHGYVVWPVAIAVWACADAAARTRSSQDVERLGLAVAAMGRHWHPQYRGYCAWLYFDGNRDIYYDDNAHAGNALVTAFEATGRHEYLRRAVDIVTGILERGWDRSDEPGGMMWHLDNRDTRNACSTLSAAQLALRLALHKVPEAGFCLDMARACIRFAERNLLSKEEGLVMDALHRQPDGAWRLDPMRWTYNSGFAIQAWLLLHRVTGEPAPRDRAVRLAATCVDAAHCSLFDDTLDPPHRIWWDEVCFAHHLVAALAAVAQQLVAIDSDDRNRIVAYLARLAAWCRLWLVDDADGLYFRPLRPYFIDQARTDRFNAAFGTHHTLTPTDNDHEPGPGHAGGRPLIKGLLANASMARLYLHISELVKEASV